MIAKLLNALPAGGKDIGVGEAALDALIGYIVVFLGIAFLIFVVWGVGKVMATLNQKQAEQKCKNPELSPQETAPSTATNEELSEETIAVIMAALTAYYETNNPKCEFTVKRIKRI